MFYYRRRNSLRLPGYDYSSPGYYFVTISTFGMVECLGDYDDGKIILNRIGKIVNREINNSVNIHPYIVLDQYVVMTNHVHILVAIKYDPNSFAPRCKGSINRTLTANVGEIRNVMNEKSLSSFVRAFKARTTCKIRQDIDSYFRWKRNFFDRIIRSERQLKNTRKYIKNNPRDWPQDSKNVPNHRPRPDK